MASASQGVDDMVTLQELSEQTLLENLKVRYNQDTYVGSILVSVNPFKRLNIYNSDKVKEYRGQRFGALPPHIFATADVSFKSMNDNRHDQSVIISGESGAGKSECTKLILQYLAAMTGNHSWVEQQILESNTILEAFGNAKTVRNNNSSRFGKFIEIHFDIEGRIVGAKIQQYLLEKSRIVHQEAEERNYHVFYQLLAGTTPEEKQNMQLTEAKNFKYLNKSGCISLPGVDDADDFQKVKLAMNVLRISNEDQDALFNAMAAILHLSNLEFAPDKDGSKVKNVEVIETVSKLLSIDGGGLEKALTIRIMKVRGSSTAIPMKPDQAADARDAFSKSIYSKVFNWLVDNINKSIALQGESQNFIGVLDIFGFENFKFNSFEQLCINFANEKLQQYFIQHIFKLEQEEYSKEKISWENITFIDNQDCLDLIEKKPVGLLSLLDEECRFPNGSDKTLLEKLHTKLAGVFKNNYVKPKTAGTIFGVKHYAGLVNYDTTGFLDKNKDSLFDELAVLVKESNNTFISGLYGDFVENDQKKKTVGMQFKEQLVQLLTTLSATEPQYVRCVKPNPQKVKDLFDDELIITQLRYSGMLETIRIRRAGYPLRFLAKSFYDRYRVLNTKVKVVNNNLLQACKEILNSLPLDKNAWTIGATKVFLKDKLLPELTELRDKKIKQFVATIERFYSAYKTKMLYKNKKASASKLQQSIKTFYAQKKFNEQRRASSLLNSEIRRKAANQDYKKLRAAAVVFQKDIRRFNSRKLYEIQKKNKASAGSAPPVPPPLPPLFQPPTKIVIKRRERRIPDAAPNVGGGNVPPPPPPPPPSLTAASSRLNIRRRGAKGGKEDDALLSVLDEIILENVASSSDEILDGLLPSTVEELDMALLNDLNKQFSTLQNFLDMDLFNEFANAEVEVEATKPNATRNIFDQLDALDNFLDQTTGETHEEDVQLITSSSKGSQEDGTVATPLPVIKMPAFDPFQYFKGVEIEDMARVLFANEKSKKEPKFKELVSWSKNTIKGSLLPFQSERMVKESVEIFDAIQKYMGDVPYTKDFNELIELILSRGLKVPQFRDEVYSQLIKQTNNNPKIKHTGKGLELIAMCASLFTPSTELRVFLCNHLHYFINIGGENGPKANFALKRLARLYQCGASRRYILGSAEVKSCQDAKPMLIRIHLMDGGSKVIDADGCTTPGELIGKLAEKIDLREKIGFSLYIVISDETEYSLRENEQLGDVLTWWEKKDPSYKIVFKKKVFLDPKEVVVDPVADYLLFHQASVEFVDDKFACTEGEAIKLAAFMVQILWSDYDNIKNKPGSIKQIENDIPRYIPKSMVNPQNQATWVANVMERYKSFGKMSALEARDRYMKQIKQFPIYGATLFKAKPTDAWFAGHYTVWISVNYKQLAILDKTKKTVLAAYELPLIYVCSYTSKAFECIIRDGSKNDKEHSFETTMGSEIDPLVRTYSAFYRKTFDMDGTDDSRRDEAEHYADVQLPPPLDVNRFNILDYAKELRPGLAFSWSAVRINDPMHKMSANLGTVSVEIYEKIMLFMGDMDGPKSKASQHAHVKFIISKGINNPSLRNEIYAQIIKQMINNTKILSKRKAWQLLFLCASSFLPSKEFINYVRCFLQQFGDDQDEQGANAVYCHKRLQKTINTNGSRKETPSVYEMECVKKHKPLCAKVNSVDGSLITVMFDSSSTAKEVLGIAAKKLNLNDTAPFALYLLVGNVPDHETSIKDTVILADIIAQNENIDNYREFKFKLSVKQKVPDAETKDPEAQNLMFWQTVDDLINEKIPATEQDFFVIAPLLMQVMYGDYNSATAKNYITEYELQRYMPKNIAVSLRIDEWKVKLLPEYVKLAGKSTDVCKDLILKYLNKWPMFGTKIFHAKQSLSVNLPKELWLGVNSSGIHVFQPNRKEPVVTYPYSELLNWGPSNDSFFFMFGDLMQPQKFVFNTKQGADISELMHVYVAKASKNKPVGNRPNRR